MELRQLREVELSQLYRLIYDKKEFDGDPARDWRQWDGPYFDWEALTEEDFLEKKSAKYLSDNVRGIYVDDALIGLVTSHFEDKKTRWLELGIAIYNSEKWSRGIGREALNAWVSILFEKYPEIERVGLTTWSGNYRMLNAARAAGFKEEARLRKCRYFKDHYYDSVKFGLTRREWQARLDGTEGENLFAATRYNSPEIENLNLLKLAKATEISYDSLVYSAGEQNWQVANGQIFLILLEGEAELKISDDQCIPLNKGEIVRIRAGILYRLNNLAEYNHYLSLTYKT